MQEEIKRSTIDGTSSKEAEEDFSVVSKESKAKGKKSKGKEGGNKMDLMKFKCFHYDDHVHYAKNCPQQKESKDSIVAAEGEALSSQLELDFTLIAWMANTIMGGVWYLDNGASFHMMGSRYLFSDFLKRKTSRRE